MKNIYINPYWSLSIECNLTCDWCLVVQRGIPCENHTQIFSYHVTNCPEFETVEKFVDLNNDKLNDMINKFVDYNRMREIKSEYVASAFYYDFLKYIIDECEKYEESRTN